MSDITDWERDLWDGIAKNIAAKRESEDAARKAHNDAIDWSWLPNKCPECWCGEYAKIQDANLHHTGQVRCVNCKHVFGPEPTP